MGSKESVTTNCSTLKAYAKITWESVKVVGWSVARDIRQYLSRLLYSRLLIIVVRSSIIMVGGSIGELSCVFTTLQLISFVPRFAV